jgi:hypothetical protein
MGSAHDHDEHDPDYEAERGYEEGHDATPRRRRRKVSSAEAAAAAAAIIPDGPRPPVETRAATSSGAEKGGDDVETGEGSGSPVAGAGEAVGGAWGRIVETVYALNPEDTYARLVSDLRLGTDATSYGAVLPALDRAERNYFDAVRLARMAKLEDEEVTRAANSELEILRTTARAELDAEKASGKRSKAPTIQDVEDRILANWPDRSSRLARKRAAMHGALRSVEGLVDAWRSRCSTLRVIAEKVSPNR